jgi:type IX secretion system PorP/SprF family membrane protein
MKVTKIIFGFTLSFIGFTAKAQQQSQYSMYMMNNYTLNPAVGGTENYTDLKASFRKQWVGFSNTPTNIYLSGHTAIGKTNYSDPDIRPLAHHGVGGYIFNDNTGPISILRAYGSYSYHLPLTNAITASIGAFLGVQNFSLNKDALDFHDDQNGVTDATTLGIQSKLMPDASLGTWIYHKNYYVGASLFQLFNNEIKIGAVQNGNEVGKLKPHFFTTAGYRVPLNDNLTWVPSVVVKNVTRLQLDLNSKIKYKEIAWAGISYRKKDAVVAMLGVTAKEHWDIAYSYDFTTSTIREYSAGSHEILIGYRWLRNSSVKPTSQFW